MADKKETSYTLNSEDRAVILKIQSRLSKVVGKLSETGAIRIALRRYLDQLNGVNQ